MAFTAIVLSPESQNACIAAAIKLGVLPIGHPAKCHHVTLAIGVPASARIGSHREMTVTAYGLTEGRVAAFRVNGASDSKNKVPHVTIAVFSDAKPVESNQIEKWVEIPHFDICGKVEICE